MLLVDGDGTRLEDAADLAGLSAAEADGRLRDRLGRGWRVAAIGPAGECGVRYATISHDGRHAGRGGLGAVMGAKNLKAIAVRAAGKVATADPDAVLAAARDLRARSFGPATAKYRELGTLANLLAFNAISTLPTRNFQAATFDGAEKLAAEAVADAPEAGPGADPGPTDPRRGGHAPGRAQQLRVLHDRLRAHLPGGPGQEGPGGVRERVRARPDVRGERPGGGARRERPLRRPRHRHDLGRRHDRVGDGVRAARPDRRALAPVRRLRRAAARA